MKAQLSLLLILPLPAALGKSPSARSIQILNESTRRVEVHWVNPDTKELVLQTTPDILHGASFALNSFVGHYFQVTELPAKKTGECFGEDGACRTDHFTVNSNKDQAIIIREGVEVEHTDSKSIASNAAAAILDDCNSAAKRALADDGSNAADVLESFDGCFRKGVTEEIEKANEEVSFQAGIRKTMAGTLERYACFDEKLNTTESDSDEYWEGRKVKVLVDRPASKVHVIEDFLTEDECRAIQ